MEFLTCVGHIFFCGDLVGFGYAHSRRVTTSLPFVATDFLNFNIMGNSIYERLYFASNTKLILADAWPCQVPNLFKSARAEMKLYDVMT